MVNPNRGGAWRGNYVNGRGGPRSVVTPTNPTTHVDNGVSPIPSHNNSNRGGMLPRGVGRGFRGRGGDRGVDRGRGIPRGFRGGRGRAAQVAS